MDGLRAASCKGRLSTAVPFLIPLLVFSGWFALTLSAHADPPRKRRGKDYTKPANTIVKRDADFSPEKIKGIMLPPKRTSQEDAVLVRIQDAICSKVKGAGYDLLDYKPYSDNAGPKLWLTIGCWRGQALKAFMRKKGFTTVNPSENYKLSTSMKITVPQGQTRKIVYSAECSMWHEFRPKTVPEQEMQTWISGLFGITEITTYWEVDFYGKGPNNLAEAEADMVPALTDKLSGDHR